MTKAYVCLSRVRQAEDLLIAQPFSPLLFRQGVMVGPHLLLERLRALLTEEEVNVAWERLETDYDGIERTFTAKMAMR